MTKKRGKGKCIGEYDKMGALKYLARVGPRITNEWVGAGMYSVVLPIILADKNTGYTKRELDILLLKVVNY